MEEVNLLLYLFLLLIIVFLRDVWDFISPPPPLLRKGRVEVDVPVTEFALLIRCSRMRRRSTL